jgi:DNA helicase TIP49 (TBP-interacting protein)
VTNYPRKGKKTAAKVARNIVLIVERTKGAGKEYLLLQRPSTGKTTMTSNYRFGKTRTFRVLLSK